MIVYRSGGLRIAQVWFDEPDRHVRADIVRYTQVPAPPAGAAATPFSTLVVDLARGEDELLSAMRDETRYEIRRASREGIACAGGTPPDGDALERFREAYAPFAAARGLPPLPWAHVERLSAAGHLDLSWAARRAVELVFHVHVVVGGRARLLYSVSPGDDPAARRAAGRANRLLHWSDMLRFKGRGVALYDFGGWYEGKTDEKKLGINRFKASFGGRALREFNAERLVTARARVAAAVASLIGRR
jgi:hypothetical protein